MDNQMLIGIIALSTVLNIVLFVRNKIWKVRTLHYGDIIETTNTRLKLAWNMLLGVAVERGVDEQEFTSKMVALSQVPEEFQKDMVEKVLPPASNKSGNSIGFD